MAIYQKIYLVVHPMVSFNFFDNFFQKLEKNDHFRGKLLGRLVGDPFLLPGGDSGTTSKSAFLLGENRSF